MAGLDDILDGGLIRERAYLVRGGPGRGKTTLGLHFLSAPDDGRPALFIGFQESEQQLRNNAESVGIDVSAIQFLSLAPDEHFFTDQQAYDVFAAADVEQEPLARAVIEAVERHAPSRIFVDSLSQLRFLSADIFQYRKQVLSLLRYLAGRGATVLFSSESTSEFPDDDLQFMADGVISLDTSVKSASVRVTKFRGSAFRRGGHQMRVNNEGFNVFVAPVPPKSKLTDEERWRWRSGIDTLDTILGGGIEAGTVSLITGPSGVGKSTMASLFAAEAAKQGRRAAVFLFEEEVATFMRRAKALKINLEAPCRDGGLLVEQVEPMRYLADEFAERVRRHVEEDQVELVVLDSVAGLELALDGEDIRDRLHVFAKSLARIGVSVVLINETEMMMGHFRVSERGI
ncbi:MAG TPA: ATPase domain-containing protein, partial [Gammaproteobacteria bacterium]|nr:ATPase domain-containing protein [Gammaproteobacteria bacterium]